MKKKTRVLLIISLIVLACVLGSLIALQKIQKNLNDLKALRIEDIPLEKVADGVYIGEYGVFPVMAQVEVIVKDHAIEIALIWNHQNGQGSAGEAVVEKAAQLDSLQVDVVAGATYSSKVLLKAMENALRQGLAP